MVCYLWRVIGPSILLTERLITGVRCLAFGFLWLRLLCLADVCDLLTLVSTPAMLAIPHQLQSVSFRGRQRQGQEDYKPHPGSRTRQLGCLKTKDKTDDATMSVLGGVEVLSGGVMENRGPFSTVR
ncbi:MAG: hypothetical protein CM1200mP9_09550 [Gammaproteobacteria bacterium]|nr:MAG: hypothetical protein CM1200mP9_09550 [Gammaproteobacteria bacterium]